MLTAYAKAYGPIEAHLVSTSPRSELAKFSLVRDHLPQVSLTYLSDLTPAQLEAEYRSATLLLHLARYESFGLPLIEAASWGLPVVATRTGIAPELLTGRLASLLVNGDWPEDCVRAMRDAVASGDVLRQAAFESYVQRFTRAAMVDAFLAVLESWAAGKQSPKRKGNRETAPNSLAGSMR
jgi:glycosyltransferase involved in cell wall biosynthesis